MAGEGMLRVKFSIMGHTQLDRALSRYGRDIKDFRPVWGQLRDDFWKIEEAQFESQGARGGTGWAPLSMSYKAWKDKWFPGKPILELTGNLKIMFTVGIGMAIEMMPLTLLMRPTNETAYYHQAGTGRMPARPVVQLTEDDKRRWIKMIQNYVYDMAKKEGLAR